MPLAGGQPDPGWQVFLAGAEPRDIPLATGRSAYWRVSVHRPGETKAFQSACSALREADPVKRRAAIEEWDRQRPLMKTGFLLEALFDADADLKKLAAAALGKSGDVSALLPLAMLAKDQTDKAIKQAFLAAARKILDAQDDAHRATAVNELTKSRTDEALELLDGIWNDTARDVRKMAAQTFYRFGDKPKVHEAYRSLSRDDDEFIRIQAALRWSRTGSKEATELVVDLLESEVRWDREQALNELSKRAGDRFAFDVKAEPGSKRNEEALAKWKAWLKRAPADTQPAEQ